jgi:hypothetical protein
MNNDIKCEWDRHESNYARSWRASMKARGKMVDAEHAKGKKVSSRIKHLCRTLNPGNSRELKKDIPLIETALATDCIIISCDNDARKLYDQLAQEMDVLKSVVWVHPGEQIRDLILWLRNGARPEDQKQLRLGQISD